MYNEEVKQRYMDYKMSITKLDGYFLKRCFDYSEPLESKYEKDLCNFVEDEIMEWYKMLSYSSFTTLKNINSQMTQYANWCVAEGLSKDNQNHFASMYNEQIRECINNVKIDMKICTYDEIKNIIARLDNVRDKCLVLALFEGIKGKGGVELESLSKESIVDSSHIRLTTGQVIKVDSMLINLINESCDTYKYNSLNVRTVYELNGNNAIKLRPQKENSRKREFSVRIKVIFKNLSEYLGLDVPINQGSVYESGRLHYIKLEAQEHGFSPYDFVSKHYNGSNVQKKYGRINSTIYLNKYQNQLL